MNEQIAAAQVGDNYTDALTLGPLPPDVAQGVDVTVQAAAVLAQLFRNSPQGQQTQEDREYLLLPGSRHVSNVAGIRFRNQYAGVPAIVTASLTGPDFPLIGPILADIPLVGAPLLVPATFKAGIIGAIEPFDGVPPSGYSGILVYAQNNSGAGIFLNVFSELPPGSSGVQVGGSQSVYLADGSTIFWVVTVPASTVGVGFQNGAPNATPLRLGVWPTNLPPGVYNLPPGEVLLNLHPSAAIPTSGNQLLDLPAFVGNARIHALNVNTGPWLLIVSNISNIGAFLGELARAPVPAAAGVANGIVDLDIRLPPGRNQLNIFNQSGIAGNTSLFDVTVTGQSTGLVTLSS